VASRLNALTRHLALAGFMGAGKTTIGAEVARRTGRRFVDLDAEIERRAGASIAVLFSSGEGDFRRLETETAAQVLAGAEPVVVALGGGTVLDVGTRELLRERALTVLLDVDPHDAWARTQGANRPLAREEEAFHRLYAERQETYDLASDVRARDADGVVLAAAGVHVQVGSLELLGDHVPGEGAVEIVADANVAGIHGVTAQLALGARDVATHEVPAGEAAKSASSLERLWRALGIGRDGALVALGGGCTTDVAGFAAATYMRGVDWVAVPTTLVGQVDAAIGGKTAIDLPAGKNLVGAFHWPAAVVVDPGVLETLPAAQIRNGLAEVVKTGLLAGEPLWELPRHEQVRRCAAFKAGVCLADPHDHGPRMQLNLGHTFAHALEAAAGYDLAHGEALALGLLAALRLAGHEEGVETVERVLAPQPVRVDRDVAWAALARDKKSAGGVPRLVLLDAGHGVSWGVEVEPAEVRAALDALIAS
jgi:3-dehydroquinate synthetase/shikimate kinase